MAPPGTKRPRPRRRTYANNNVNQLAKKILDTYPFGADKYRELFNHYVQLLRNTSLPTTIGSNDKQVIFSLQALERFTAIANTQRWVNRLYYIQVAKTLDQLQNLIRKDRLEGKLECQVGKNDKSIAIDIHFAALSSMQSRKDIKTRRRFAQRWLAFSQNSLIPLLFASDQADKIIRDFSVSLNTLKLLGEQILSLCTKDTVNSASNLVSLIHTAANNQYSPEQQNVLISQFEASV
ncbi:hypothetical protein F5Y16DRAFT_418335 [Xylariaceae sp. FL0255]|nr:hypothetical protein F5Y16DRAFT_418335 [Xylariaceae sp. FL0255]